MQERPPASRWWQSKTGVGVAAFLAVAGFFLVVEHRAHIFGALPYLLLLACPVLHFFMHGHGHGHGGHGGRGKEPRP